MSFIVYGAPDGPGKVAERVMRARHLWHRAIHSVGLYLGLGLGLIVSLFIAIALIPKSPAPQPAPEPLPRSAWAEIEQPARMYGLSTGEFAGDPAAFAAKRHRDGRGRIDVMTWGQLDDDAQPYLRLAVHRVGREPVEDSSFFIHMVREAAGFGAAITRGHVADPMQTRFGLFEAGDVTLESTGASAQCLGFRFSSPERLIRMTGFACGTADDPIDRPTLACTIDRISLISAGEDHDLKKFFATAEAGRDPRCAPRTAQPQAAEKNVQASWIDQAGTAPLRGVATKPRRR